MSRISLNGLMKKYNLERTLEVGKENDPITANDVILSIDQNRLDQKTLYVFTYIGAPMGAVRVGSSVKLYQILNR